MENIKLKLRKYIREIILSEMNVSGNIGGYSTPFAFSKKPISDKKYELFGYKRLKNKRKK